MCLLGSFHWNLCVLTGVVSCIYSVLANNQEVRLVKDLMKNYERSIRPVNNSSQPVIVKFGLALNQIVELDERNQLLVTTAWMRLKWSDHNLQWNASEYNVEETTLASNRVWIPDISIYNNAGDSFLLQPNTGVKVLSNGSVSWLTPARLKTSCKIDVTYFPFDEQRCNLTFGSWIFSGKELNFLNTTHRGDNSTLIDGGEWELIDFPIIRNAVMYECCDSPFIDITAIIVIRRRSLYYVFNLVLPVILMSIVAIVGFYLPPDSGEKVSLGVTVLLAMTVFLLLIAETMPPTSEVIPLMGQYFGCSIVLLSLSTSMAVFVINVHYKGADGTAVPKWLKLITIGGLAKFFFMSVKQKELYNAMRSFRGEHPNENGNDVIANVELEHVSVMQRYMRNSNGLHRNSKSTFAMFEILSHVKQIQKDITKTRDENDAASRRASEWRLVAWVIDRLFLVLFLLINVITTVTILTNQ